MEFLAGYGEKIITPPLGVELCGYGFYLNRRAESVQDDLKARAVVLKSGPGTLALISCDLIGFSVEMADKIRRRAAEKLGIPAANVLLACTHTHTGPATLSLPGLGDPDPAYLLSLPEAILDAVEKASSDLGAAGFSSAREAVEPIGFNRRLMNFQDIDPYLKMGFIHKKNQTIFLLNYACHAVTLGRSPRISADWPGALVRELEKDGHRAIVFQGFCGDIDPVVFLNRWGSGTEDDLLLYARILADRAKKALKSAAVSNEVRLRAAERRFRVPLNVCRRDDIEAEACFFLEKNKSFPLADRFAEEWKQQALERHGDFWQTPYLEGVPIQALAVGDCRIIGQPGEIFCRLGLNLMAEYPSLLTIGYANGDIGYIPTASSFEDTGDYACYCAPRFYTLFPFAADVERIFLKESREALAALTEKPS
jgi:hypothetical protein